MDKVYKFFGGRKQFNFLIVYVLGVVMVFFDKLPGEFYFGSLIAGLGVYAHYNVKSQAITEGVVPSEDNVGLKQDITVNSTSSSPLNAID